MALCLTALAGAAQVKAAPLKVEIYNPGEKGAFPVSSEIISGKSEVLLVDAQFRRSDAEALVDRLKATGKILTAIYISQSDPDFYFGLDTVTAAFPGVKVLATPQTVSAIRANKDAKLAYWGPMLKDQAPRALIVPQAIAGESLRIDGEVVKIVGLDGPSPDRTALWIPSERTIVGGVVVFAGSHVWMADTQTPSARKAWIAELDRIIALKPRRVVPGHFIPGADDANALSVQSVKFTRDYVQAFDEEAARASDAALLIAAMKSRYPSLPGEPVLEMSAKVAKGEMKWP
ncbi:MBL fold metallo-hydrolase [Phenylobacterium montanum]|uniref:MBL fold metallo-hydrolase n=1 Tax=Phenylobacterium montanum TaxID=2823693 RepID=A0A975IXD4_9CAUL|nr:MBL fold metallo-hydrolase [Caulobacter sp. S6]